MDAAFAFGVAEVHPPVPKARHDALRERKNELKAFPISINVNFSKDGLQSLGTSVPRRALRF